MRLLRTYLLCIIAVFGIAACGAINKVGKKKDLSPYGFGLATAITGEERYQVLLETHRAAVKSGVNVDYSGIDTIRLEIPAKPSLIPLTQFNDFKGCVFLVKNTQKACYLFGCRNESEAILIDKKLIDSGNFRSVDALKRGRHLLIVEDEKLWVLNREGHSYGHPRRDIMLVENGLAKNKAVKPYNNVYSKPKCTVVKLGDESLIIKNISIVRDPDCTFLTHIANIAGADDVRFENVSIKTPESELTDDRGISIYDCTNVTMDNVRIDGTYSHLDHSGYGIFLNNVWNYKATRLYGKANWGIYGNNNVNVTRIEDSQINRFDIHCYGRDISFKNVNFFDLYNQYSSVYGTIRYDKCTFTNFTPVLNGGSYNAFVKHEVVMNDCVFNVTPNKNYILKMENMKEANNSRHELVEKCFPNVRIKNLVVNMTKGTEEFFMFYEKKVGEGVINVELSNITIDGLTINPSGEKPVKWMSLSNFKIGTKAPVDCQIKNVMVNNPLIKSLFGSSRLSMQLKANMPLKGGKATLKNATGIIQ